MSITREDYVKIQSLLETIESVEGAMIPFNTAKKISEVYKELQGLLDQEVIE